MPVRNPESHAPTAAAPLQGAFGAHAAPQRARPRTRYVPPPPAPWWQRLVGALAIVGFILFAGLVLFPYGAGKTPPGGVGAATAAQR